jgi:asparagine synthase (glutamine-hydrolysing)
MCGISGIIGYKATESQLLRSIKSLKHRGPDGNGFYINVAGNVGFAHTRLSIIDLTTGGQPLFSEDKSIVIVVNGEIYDFERLREDLIKKGHNFSTKSDSEVVLNLYREYGPDKMFEYMRGEFAFLLYDQKKNIVIAARDRFGIKPLYMAETNGKFVFSSEAKGIFATGIVKPEIDPVAARNMLSLAVVDTVFKNIKSLDPSCYLRIDMTTNKSELVRYWDIDLPTEAEMETPKSLEEYKEIVRREFDEAVSLRLRADVPVGVYLSGGIDSAAVAGTIAKVNKKKLHAFTVAFVDDDKFNELALATKMAESIGAELHVAKCSNDTLLENLHECLWYSEIPTVNLHGVGKFILSKLAKKHVTVVLTGEGSDETFLGYDYFKDPNTSLSDMFKKMSSLKNSDNVSEQAKILEAEFGFIPQNEMIRTFAPRMQRLYRRMFHDRHREALLNSSQIDLVKRRIDRKQTDGRSWVRKIQYYSIRGMMTPYILSILGDRQEMAHAVEGRTPLLDHHVFASARQIPDSLKIKDGVEKYIFREAMKERVIPEIYNNKKWPYSAPPVWLSTGTSPTITKLLKEHLSKKAIKEAGVFRYLNLFVMRAIHKWLPGDTVAKRRINAYLVFVLCIQMIHDLYIKNFDKNIDSHAKVEFT